MVQAMVKAYTECQMTRANPPVARLNALSWAFEPCSRLYMDFAFMNHRFLAIIDAAQN